MLMVMVRPVDADHRSVAHFVSAAGCSRPADNAIVGARIAYLILFLYGSYQDHDMFMFKLEPIHEIALIIVSYSQSISSHLYFLIAYRNCAQKRCLLFHSVIDCQCLIMCPSSWVRDFLAYSMRLLIEIL